MDILAAAVAQICDNALLLSVSGLDVDRTVARMRETATLYSPAFACAEVARELFVEAQFLEDEADENPLSSQRKIAAMMRMVAHNLNNRIRYEHEPVPVV